MAKTDERVMKMVEQELAKNPDVSVEQLFEKAKGVNSGVARMNRRQFHARYPLQVKRRKGGVRKRKAGASKGRKREVTRGRTTAARGTDRSRDAVRQVFLRFAQDVASAAESPKDLVKLIVNVDRYVDDAVRAKR